MFCSNSVMIVNRVIVNLHRETAVFTTDTHIVSCVVSQTTVKCHRVTFINNQVLAIPACRSRGYFYISISIFLFSTRSSHPLFGCMNEHLTVVSSYRSPGTNRLFLALPSVSIVQLELHCAYTVVQICVRVGVNRIAIVRKRSLGHRVLLPIVCVALAIDIQLNRVRADSGRWCCIIHRGLCSSEHAYAEHRHHQ